MKITAKNILKFIVILFVSLTFSCSKKDTPSPEKAQLAPEDDPAFLSLTDSVEARWSFYELHKSFGEYTYAMALGPKPDDSKKIEIQDNIVRFYAAACPPSDACTALEEAAKGTSNLLNDQVFSHLKQVSVAGFPATQVLNTEQNLSSEIATLFSEPNFNNFKNKLFKTRNLDVSASYTSQARSAVVPTIGISTYFISTRKNGYVPSLWDRQNSQLSLLLKNHPPLKAAHDLSIRYPFINGLEASEFASIKCKSTGLCTTQVLAKSAELFDFTAHFAPLSDQFKAAGVDDMFISEFFDYMKGYSLIQKLKLLKALHPEVPKGEVQKSRPQLEVLNDIIKDKDLFGPFITKRMQQVASRMPAPLEEASADIKQVFGLFQGSKQINLDDTLKKLYKEKVALLLRDSYPNITVEKVLSAGSLGVVFSIKDNGQTKVLKWIPTFLPSEGRKGAQALLLDEKARYEQMLKDVTKQAATPEQRDLIQRKIASLTANIEEIDGYIEETDLTQEVANGEKLIAAYGKEFSIDGRVVFRPQMVGGEVLKLLSDKPPDKLRKQFNIQAMAPGDTLKDISKTNITPAKESQIKNAMMVYQELHLKNIFSGQPFHSDAHEGNLYIEFGTESDSYPKNFSLIDGGAMSQLKEEQLFCMRQVFTKDSITDEEIIKYIKGMSKAGINFERASYNEAEFKAFSDFVKNGDPVPSEQILRQLRLEDPVVAAIKAVGTLQSALDLTNTKLAEGKKLVVKNLVNKNKFKEIMQEAILDADAEKYQRQFDAFLASRDTSKTSQAEVGRVEASAIFKLEDRTAPSKAQTKAGANAPSGQASGTAREAPDATVRPTETAADVAASKTTADGVKKPDAEASAAEAARSNPEIPTNVAESTPSSPSAPGLPGSIPGSAPDIASAAAKLFCGAELEKEDLDKLKQATTDENFSLDEKEYIETELSQKLVGAEIQVSGRKIPVESFYWKVDTGEIMLKAQNGEVLSIKQTELPQFTLAREGFDGLTRKIDVAKTLPPTHPLRTQLPDLKIDLATALAKIKVNKVTSTIAKNIAHNLPIRTRLGLTEESPELCPSISAETSLDNDFQSLLCWLELKKVVTQPSH